MNFFLSFILFLQFNIWNNFIKNEENFNPSEYRERERERIKKGHHLEKLKKLDILKKFKI